MDIIEQAAKRLEQLRLAGVDVGGGLEASSAVDGEESHLRQQDTRTTTTITDPSGVSTSPSSGPLSRRVNLDMEALSARGIVTPTGVRSQLFDELRVIKRPLLHNVAGKSAASIKDANLIVITSAMPGEGKTHLAINLAISIAMELDHTVLLVDADVARPTIPKVLGFGIEKGLLDVLQDSSLDLSQVLLRTNIDKLSILPAGTPHPRATEMLASDAMTHLVADMAKRYPDRIIIFDSPPLLVSTEARVLASHMGQVILCVKADSTSHAEVKNAIATIESCPVKMAVLSQASGHFDGHGYGYGYGYGYGAHIEGSLSGLETPLQES